MFELFLLKLFGLADRQAVGCRVYHSPCSLRTNVEYWIASMPNLNIIRVIEIHFDGHMISYKDPQYFSRNTFPGTRDAVSF